MGKCCGHFCFDIFLVSFAHSSFPLPHSGPRICWWTIKTALRLVPPAAHHPPLLACFTYSECQAHLPETPLSLSSTGSFGYSKALHNLGFLHPPQPYPTGSEYLFSDLVNVFSTQAHPPVLGPLAWHTLLFPSVLYNSAASSSLSINPAFSELYCLINIWLFLLFCFFGVLVFCFFFVNQQSTGLSLWVVHSTLNRGGRWRVIVPVGRLLHVRCSLKNVIFNHI